MSTEPGQVQKPVDAAVVLGVAEQRLDGLCAFSVEQLAELGREYAGASMRAVAAGPQVDVPRSERAAVRFPY